MDYLAISEIILLIFSKFNYIFSAACSISGRMTVNDKLWSAQKDSFPIKGSIPLFTSPPGSESGRGPP